MSNLTQLRDAPAPLGTTRGDVALAVALTLLGQVDVWLGSAWVGPRWLNACAMLVSGLALAWRRTRPLESLIVVVLPLIVLSLTSGVSDSPVQLFLVLVAAYSAAAHADQVVLAFTIVSLGIAVHDVLDPRIRTLGDAAYDSTVVLLALGLGLTTRRRQGRMVAAERQAAEARDRAEKAAAAASAEERQKMARELHDIIAHSLGIVVLQAGAAEEVFDHDPEKARESLQLIRRTGTEAVHELGRMLGLLRGEPEPARAPQPTLRDLDDLVDRAARAGLDARLQISGNPIPTSPAVELSAYRIVQEGLTNALKHAPRGRTLVELSYLGEQLQITVTNDCNGQDASLPSGGRGLPGIRERVSVLGGTFEAGREAGRGPSDTWRLHAALPAT